MSRSGNNVRLTEQAHALLSEKAEDYNATQKDIASEAIMMMFNLRDNEKQDNRRYAFGTFALGALAGGCVMYFSVVI